MNSSWKFI